MVAKSKKNLYSKFNWKLIAISGLVFIGLIAILELTNATHLFHKQTPVSGSIPATNPSITTRSGSNSPVSQVGSSSTTPASDSTNPKSDTATSGSGTLLAPYGTFVSNHRPSLSGSNGVPSQEQSVCLTTPGASCLISFTNNGVIKTLDSQIADSKGAVYWSWDVKKAGFTEASWSVSATASLNGQSKDTKDSLDLTIDP